MYFTSPRQLPEIYGQLEEANLFLIQNAQETEDILEDLKNKEGRSGRGWMPRTRR